MRKFAQLQPILSDNHHHILGVGQNADKEAIQSAWKRLVPLHHPDRFVDENDRAVAHNNISKINNARDVLLAELDKQNNSTFQNPFTNFSDGVPSDKPGKKEAIRFANEIIASPYFTELSKVMHQHGKTTKDAWFIYYLWATRSGYKRKLVETQYPNVINAFKKFRAALTIMGAKTMGEEALFSEVNIISTIVQDKVQGKSDGEIHSDLVNYLIGDY